MARFTLTNRGSTGWVSPTLAAYTNWQYWQHALVQAENVVVPPQGGLKKRPCLRLISETTSSDAGVGRIFRFNKNDREKFVVGLKPATTAGEYTASILFAAGIQAAQPQVEGNLEFTDLAQVKGFHYADSLLFSQLDGKAPPQRLVRESQAESNARESILVLEETGIAIPWAPDGFGALGMNNPLQDVLAEITIGTQTAETAINQNSGSQSRNYDTAPFRGFSFFYEWDAATGRYEFRLTTNRDHPFNNVVTEPIQVVFTRRTRTTDTGSFVKTADTYTADFNPAVGGTRSLTAARGFKAEKVTIYNPPIRELADQAAFDAEVTRIGAAYCVKIANPASNNDVGERVLKWDGATLTAEEPGEDRRGYTTRKQKDTFYAMAWNPTDGWPATFGFRHNRLFAAGSGDRGSQFRMSVAGDALDFLAYTRDGDEDDRLIQGIQADFALSRTLDSFSQITEFYSDNGLLILTEDGEHSIQGALQAGSAGTGTARARKYSSNGSNRFAGVASIDNKVFYAARKAAFAIQFQGDDIGYPYGIDITSLRNELALDGEVVRITEAQPANLTGAKMVLFLVRPADGSAPYIAVWHTETAQEHFAWSKWTFPRHTIRDLVSIDNLITVVADLDGDTTQRGVYAFDADAATATGEAGDQVKDTLEEEGALASFPVVMETPEITAVPIAGDSGLLLPVKINRIHFTAEQAGGIVDDDQVECRIKSPGAVAKVVRFPNKIAGEVNVPQGEPYGKRIVEDSTANLQATYSYRRAFYITITQDNLHPFHFLRLDIDCDAGRSV